MMGHTGGGPTPTGPGRTPAPITSLQDFRRDRVLNDWCIALFVTCLCVLSGVLAVKLSPLVANSVWSSF